MKKIILLIVLTLAACSADKTYGGAATQPATENVGERFYGEYSEGYGVTPVVTITSDRVNYPGGVIYYTYAVDELNDCVAFVGEPHRAVMCDRSPEYAIVVYKGLDVIASGFLRRIH